MGYFRANIFLLFVKTFFDKSYVILLSKEITNSTTDFIFAYMNSNHIDDDYIYSNLKLKFYPPQLGKPLAFWDFFIPPPQLRKFPKIPTPNFS